MDVVERVRVSNLITDGSFGDVVLFEIPLECAFLKESHGSERERARKKECELLLAEGEK